MQIAFFTALLTTFNIAILGTFSPGSFEQSVVPWIAQLVFASIMVGVTVVALDFESRPCRRSLRALPGQGGTQATRD